MASQTAGAAELELVRIREEAAWQARIESTLEVLEGHERDRIADQLQGLLDEYAPSRDKSISAGAGGLATSGDVTVRADHGSIAAGVLHGGVQIGPPPPPDPFKG